MNESDLKAEVKTDTLAILPGIIWCNHQDKVQGGIADTEIVYRGYTIWIEFKYWRHKTLNSPLLQEKYLKPLQLEFLRQRYYAGIKTYCGIFIDRNTLRLITPDNIHNSFIKNDFLSQTPVAHHISRKGIWNLKPIFEEYENKRIVHSSINVGDKWFS